MEKLWGGFSRYALRDLDELKRCVSALRRRSEVRRPGISPAGMLFEHDYMRALDCVVFARVIDPSGFLRRIKDFLRSTAFCTLVISKRHEKYSIRS